MLEGDGSVKATPRKIAGNEIDALGDTSTLADPSVIEDLLRNRKDD